MPFKLKLILGFVLIVGAFAFGWGWYRTYQWIMAEGVSTDGLAVTPVEVMAIGLVALTGSIPFALAARAICIRREQSPEEIPHVLVVQWLAANLALAFAACLVASAVYGNSAGIRLGIVWLCFAFAAVPKGLSAAARNWANYERHQELRAMIAKHEQDMREFARRSAEREPFYKAARGSFEASMKRRNDDERSAALRRYFTGKW